MPGSTDRILAAAVVLWSSIALGQSAVEALDSKAQTEKDIQDPSPKIVVEERIHDFGNKIAGEKIDHVFVIRNYGDAVLEIKNARAQCGCTVVTQPPKELAIGQEAEIPVKLNTKSLRGKISKSIHVVSNDPFNPRLELKVVGEVTTTFNVLNSKGKDTRGYIRLERAVVGGPAVKETFTLVNNLEKSLEVSGVASSNKKLSASIKPIEKGHRYELTVSVAPPFVTGTIGGDLQLKSESTDHGKLKIRAMLSVVERIQVSPRALIVGRSRKKQIRRPLSLTNNGSKVISIKEAVSTNDAITVNLVKNHEGKRFRWAVIIPSDVEIAEDDKVVILTNDEEYERLEIPFKHSRIRRRATTRPEKGAKPASDSGKASVGGS
jgi:hypothetical protein